MSSTAETAKAWFFRRLFSASFWSVGGDLQLILTDLQGEDSWDRKGSAEPLLSRTGINLGLQLTAP